MVKDIAALTEAYVRLMTKLEQLIKKGLTTVIYTELTDVEYEVNGYLTYDRAEWKVDVDTVKVCHQPLIKAGAGDLPDGI